ncbi:MULTISPECIES: mycofactocin-coupled SDR family oxidoreductase [unclassified Pseudofrankia]|uniref:mycofactocin-coupled SDR family oxidoreductase n=1 Tax=unclassified Pseudofrankia TaxID=2994372 RepID=UPI0008D92FA7|nr:MULTISPECIES: mycofactocin-coupled SDR family oxidoreductase [unclassified Pseudofrankia]MDT3444933.1 mycofactocin-coupled SDR family oxidoreductase [Pseudofrankia sp. BMG5.37]OHV64837.1 3-ketoacyl-ACP reductase [Pseudofrankia sp. BMG5.36]
MAGRVDGKVALVTGAAQGQGRSHAVRLAEEGADIIAVDICERIASVPYPQGTEEGLRETASAVEALGRKIFAVRADVRDFEQLKRAVDDGVALLGHLDVVSAGAGILNFGELASLSDADWQDLMDVNLTGVWHTCKAAVPHLRAAGGGSMILTSSTAGFIGMPGIGHYVAAKHGVIGLMKTLALELGGDKIRVNTVNPTNVKTDMLMNDAVFARFAPDLPAEERTLENLIPRFKAPHALDVGWIDPIDVSNAVLWLASDESRYVTGVSITIDAGHTAQ